MTSQKQLAKLQLHQQMMDELPDTGGRGRLIGRLHGSWCTGVISGSVILSIQAEVDGPIASVSDSGAWRTIIMLCSLQNQLLMANSLLGKALIPVLLVTVEDPGELVQWRTLES